MTFLIESLIACAVFTLFVFLRSRDPVKTVFNYPPAIIERCRQLGLVDDSNRPGGLVFYVKKVVAASSDRKASSRRKTTNTSSSPPDTLSGFCRRVQSRFVGLSVL